MVPYGSLWFPVVACGSEVFLLPLAFGLFVVAQEGAKLAADVDEKLIQLMFYDNVKPLAALRETIYHYDLADEGSDGKKLSVLTSAVEKYLDKCQRARNREAEVRAGGFAQPVPGMTATETRPKRPSRKEREKRKKALIANALDDNASSDTSSVSGKSSSSAASAQTVVSAPAVMDECKEKGLCYRFQRGTCRKGSKMPLQA